MSLILMGASAVAGRSQSPPIPAPPAPPSVSRAESQILTVEGTVEVLGGGMSLWTRAAPNQILQSGDRLRTGRRSRAAVRLSDASVLRVNELTTLRLAAPSPSQKKPLLDLRSGSLYFLSREKAEELQFQTPVAAGAIRGTEFHLQVAEAGFTTLTLLDGKVELSGARETLLITSGEEATVGAGQPPRKTPALHAINKIQWTLYYPGVLDPAELPRSLETLASWQPSLRAHAQGDLLQALREMPPVNETDDDGILIFAAALLLTVGQAPEVEALLDRLRAPSPLAAALRQTIAAVNGQTHTRASPPSSASEWLAESFHLQAHSRLKEALAAARRAVERSPAFGFGWARVAELEYSFGSLKPASIALDKAFKFTPLNAQAWALRGFILSDQNQLAEAAQCFDRAIHIDGALGNAWLGRGLLRIRQGRSQEGLRDLQTAAALEPQRALPRSYLAKAFAQQGDFRLAENDLRLANTLDPNDPTPWLYSALINQRRNRNNAAVRDLERSQALNDNRSLFRSRLLLDQDRAVRAANLAAIYQDAGMNEWALWEASKAASLDYANYSAHLFLANSYAGLTDPKRFNLRYETTQASELLLAHLLAPIGAGHLSRNLAAQDPSRLFEGKNFGGHSQTEYFSGGDWIQHGSVHGFLDGTMFAIDGYYRSENGQRPNNDLEQRRLSAQIKQRLTPQDSVFFQAGYADSKSGDIAQYYDPSEASLGLRAQETQEPALYLGYHREWSPGSHTLFLASRIDDTLELTDSDPQVIFLRYLNREIARVIIPPLFTLDYRGDFELYSAELQQIWQTDSQSLVVGARYQTGDNKTASSLDRALSGRVTDQEIHADFGRVNAYAYQQWRILDSLRATAGLAYDRVEFPRNIDISPLSESEAQRHRLSPKAGLLYLPWEGGALRGVYTRSLGGLFFDNSLRLEPTQLAGFNQSFRSLLPESSAGLVPGTAFETFGAGFDQSFPSGTYLGIEGEILRSNGRRDVGVLTNSTFVAIPDRASSTPQTLDYQEQAVLLSVHQLAGEEWAFGARYRVSKADLSGRFPRIPAAANGASQINQDEQALLHQLQLSVLFNHASGFFSQFQSVWSAQNNESHDIRQPEEDFWQHHFFAGYRFPKRQAEIRAGILNLGDVNYRLNPLTPYMELPRERTFTASLRFHF